MKPSLLDFINSCSYVVMRELSVNRKGGSYNTWFPGLLSKKLQMLSSQCESETGDLQRSQSCCHHCALEQDT